MTVTGDKFPGTNTPHHRNPAGPGGFRDLLAVDPLLAEYPLVFLIENVPAGERRVYVLARGFEESWVVNVVAGETVSIGQDECG